MLVSQALRLYFVLLPPNIKYGAMGFEIRFLSPFTVDNEKQDNKS